MAMQSRAFSAVGRIGSSALAVAISIGAGAFDLHGTEVKSRFPCPSGQIYRVSKKICVPKGAVPKLLGDRRKAEDSRKPARAETLEVGTARPNPRSVDPARTHEAPEPEEVRTSQNSEVEAPTTDHETALANISQFRRARAGETSHLEELVVFCRIAMTTYRRADAPLAWAAIRNNLANALVALEERKGGSGFEEAVALYREALKETTKESAPRDWATIQTNLGHVLTILGLRESAVLKLAEAAAAEREAIDWAKRTGDEGVALMRLAEQLNDEAIARKALAQIDMAIAMIQDGDHVPLLSAYYEAQLPRARALVEHLSEPR
jgi:tetratricopeptide (TPR) repeat protein